MSVPVLKVRRNHKIENLCHSDEAVVERPSSTRSFLCFVSMAKKRASSVVSSRMMPCFALSCRHQPVSDQHDSLFMGESLRSLFASAPEQHCHFLFIDLG